MANYRMDSEEEALFRNSPYTLYFVQSPSTISHANSGELTRHSNNNNKNNNSNEFSVCHSPIPQPEVGPLALSRYSSRGSNHSFSHHEKKISCDSLQSHETGINDENVEIDHEKRCGAKLLLHGKSGNSVEEGNEYEYEYEYEEEDYYYGKGNWKRFFSLGYSNSTPWIVLQVTWRLIVSMIIALVVFYIATKPPPPKVSLESSCLEFQVNVLATSKLISRETPKTIVIPSDTDFSSPVTKQKLQLQNKNFRSRAEVSPVTKPKLQL